MAEISKTVNRQTTLEENMLCGTALTSMLTKLREIVHSKMQEYA
jgi:hypothetical protein